MQRPRAACTNRKIIQRQAPNNASVTWFHPFSDDVVPQEAKPGDISSSFTFAFTGCNSMSVDDHNQRALRFSALHAALTNMSLLPLGHSLHVDPEAAKKAADNLGVIAHNYDIPAPMIMAEDDGSVVLTWDYGRYKRYLTIDPDGSDVMDLDKKSSIKCLRELDDEYHNIVEILGISPMATSSVDVDV